MQPSHLRTVLHVLTALLPQGVKRHVYRHLFGFEVASDAQIGFSVLDVDRVVIEAGARIGHGNILTKTRLVTVGRNATIGLLNILRGGDEIVLGAHATVLRFNVLNSIPDAEVTTTPQPRLEIGDGAVVVSGHRLDFTDHIKLGKNVIIAGRNSSLWTHFRQQTAPIEIGDYCYVGSEARLAPGSRMGDLSILALGGVLSGQIESRTVAGGVPAKPIREVTEDDERMLRKKTSNTIPDDLY